MKIETEAERFRLTIIGAEVIEKAIQKDPKIIQIGYDKVTYISKLVDDLIRSRNLPESELVDVATELKDGVVDQLPTIKKALENLTSGEYDSFKVAHALSSCSATLDYIRTKYE